MIPHSGSERLRTKLIGLRTLGLSLGLFFVTSYLLCVGSYVLLPQAPISHSLALFLPGFVLLTWKSFLLGLVEAFAWGWYVALVFGPIYNFVARRT